MNTILEPKVEAMVTVGRRIVQRLFGCEVDASETAELLLEVLHGEKDLWAGLKSGLVTRREAAGALVASIHSWMMERLGRSWESENGRDWDNFIAEMEDALSEAIEGRPGTPLVGS